MAEAKKQKPQKIRLSIPLSEEIYKKIESDAEIVGVSMATYAAMIIGNHYKTQQISLDYAKDNLIEAFRGVFEPMLKAKGLNYDEVAKEEFENAKQDSIESVAQLLKNTNEN